MSQVAGVILSAGFSSRAQAFKMTLPLSGKTIIARCIEGMYHICGSIILVGGYNYKALVPILQYYPKVSLVVNENYQEGMFSSLKTGLKHVPPVSSLFITPGDYPCIGENVYQRLLDCPGEIVVPTFNNVKGHPIQLKGHLIKEILEDTALTSLRDFIRKQGFTAISVDDKGILLDVDTPEDYQRALDYISSTV